MDRDQRSKALIHEYPPRKQVNSDLSKSLPRPRDGSLKEVLRVLCIPAGRVHLLNKLGGGTPRSIPEKIGPGEEE